MDSEKMYKGRICLWAFAFRVLIRVYGNSIKLNRAERFFVETIFSFRSISYRCWNVSFEVLRMTGFHYFRICRFKYGPNVLAIECVLNSSRMANMYSRRDDIEDMGKYIFLMRLFSK